jgi:hypothetical protein
MHAMRTRYVAFGLQLHSAFPLLGMTPEQKEGLPALALELATPAELQSSWSGPSGPPAWRGRLGDGRPLTIERGTAGDALFTYGDHAGFRLGSRGRRLDCAPRHAGPDWQRALIGKVLPSIAVMRGYEALHAGAVDSPEGVVAIAGPSGSGKSTLLAELLGRGCPLFTDDELTLERDHDGVRAHPGSPHMNLALDAPNRPAPRELGRTLGVIAGERWLSVHIRTRIRRPVRMVCLLERRPGLTPGAETLPANPLHLAPHMLGLSTAARRSSDRFCLYSDLVERTTLLRLTGDLQSTPAELADILAHALARESMLEAEGTA